MVKVKGGIRPSETREIEAEGEDDAAAREALQAQVLRRQATARRHDGPLRQPITGSGRPAVRTGRQKVWPGTTHGSSGNSRRTGNLQDHGAGFTGRFDQSAHPTGHGLPGSRRITEKPRKYSVKSLIIQMNEY